MGFKFRRLLDSLYNNTAFCAANCSLTNDSYDCNGFCLPYQRPPPPPPPPSNHTNRTKFLIIGLSLSAAFFLVFTSVIYYKFYYSGSTRRRRRRDQRNETTHEEFLDEDHGPVLDHPIWYINTIGLQPYVINSIPVVNYRKGDDGLVEGRDCSVCLNEFEQDETLRLLPKCNHAFHLPCIDTWLRSHTNCPLCRAPILANSATRATTSEETRIEVMEIEQESERELEGVDGDLGGGIEEERESEDQNRIKRSEILQSIGRSVSLDSLSVFKVSQALASASSMDSDRNSRTKASESNMEIVPKRVDGSNHQNLLKSMIGSSTGRSLQVGPSSFKRSFSLNC